MKYLPLLLEPALLLVAIGGLFPILLPSPPNYYDMPITKEESMESCLKKMFLIDRLDNYGMSVSDIRESLTERLSEQQK